MPSKRASGGAAHEGGLREQLDAFDPVPQRCPVLHVDVERPVHVEACDTEGAQVRDVRLDGLDRPAGIRLEVHGDVSPAA